MAIQVQIAEDVADFVSERSKLKGVTFETCLDAILRKEMLDAAIAEANSKKANAKPYTEEPFSFDFLPGVDVENLRRYVDDLDDEELIRKMYGEEQS